MYGGAPEVGAAPGQSNPEADARGRLPCASLRYGGRYAYPHGSGTAHTCERSYVCLSAYARAIRSARFASLVGIAAFVGHTCD
eukprot:scaffold54029_cov45-Phaeocystis_antarctica.AAC.1